MSLLRLLYPSAGPIPEVTRLEGLLQRTAKSAPAQRVAAKRKQNNPGAISGRFSTPS
jgi:hypothetical protein